MSRIAQDLVISDQVRSKSGQDMIRSGQVKVLSLSG